jgi:hypothetical protein
VQKYYVGISKAHTTSGGSLKAHGLDVLPSHGPSGAKAAACFLLPRNGGPP